MVLVIDFSCENGAQPLDAELAARLHQRMKFKLKKRHTFAMGILIGLPVFAICREIWWAFAARGPAVLISETLSAIGSLKWVDTTLVTGFAAVTAAYLSVAAVRDQIKQAEQIERNRNQARHDATRAILPLALSGICQYAIECSAQLRDLGNLCWRGRLPPDVDIAAFPDLPLGAIATLKEFIEYSSQHDRRLVAKMVSTIQVQTARLQGMRSDRPRGTIVLRINIDDHILDAAEIYGRATALFEYARRDTDHMPNDLCAQDVYPALSAFGIWDMSREGLAERISRRFPGS
ncbi:hypothetical protein [Rhizobium leguminosarum]|uniref:hypothetical protein n=1 Tax=Rhizobium leguminosarum TaxID=384 RepID=UPI001C971FC1|nr:hypothetical protein [Rhizobium leguminosarum]MBY5349572.1 hypothetical protein [Rhizobium leguminosarum]